LATRGDTSTLDQTPAFDGLFPSYSSGHPSELTIGQLHKAMASGKLMENIAFNDERMRPGYVDDYSGQIFTPCGLRCAVESHRYGASLWLPIPECIETGEG
jgi:hypothetical protein